MATDIQDLQPVVWKVSQNSFMVDLVDLKD